MNFKKVTAVVLAAICTVALAGCGSSSSSSAKSGGKTLVMATAADFPPYEYRDDDNKVVGIDPEVAQAICDKLGYTLKIEDMKFDSIIPAVQSGKADFGMSGITVTDERKQSVDFSDSYVTAKQSIIVKKDSGIKSAADLKGLKVGVQEGTTGDIYITDDTDTAVGSVERYNTGFEAVQALAQGKLDAVIIDDQPAKKYIEQTSGLTILDSPYTEEEYAIALKKNSKLTAEFDKAMKELKDDGTFDKIVSKYISSDDTESVSSVSSSSLQ